MDTKRIDAAIREVTYTEDGVTTTAVATLDNGFMVTASYSCERAKHFVPATGCLKALEGVRAQVAELLRFRELDTILFGVNVTRDPSSRTRAADNDHLPAPGPVPAFDPNVTPVDAEPAPAAGYNTIYDPPYAGDPTNPADGETAYGRPESTTEENTDEQP